MTKLKMRILEKAAKSPQRLPNSYRPPAAGGPRYYSTCWNSFVKCDSRVKCTFKGVGRKVSRGR